VLGPMAMMSMADWNPGDSYKMHYPQLPDPNGWDVAWTTNLADDWECTQTGSVDDVHLWFSWRGDNQGIIDAIAGISVSIYNNDPGPPSKPLGTPIWGQSFLTSMSNVTIRPYATGNQGWYDPMQQPPTVLPGDHTGIWQVNITDILNPFEQKAGEIYWLGVYIELEDTPPAEIGWKTSGSPHFMDDAVYWDGGAWQVLEDPSTGQSLDLAFVITTIPEPATMGVLAAGALWLAALRRRRK